MQGVYRHARAIEEHHSTGKGNERHCANCIRLTKGTVLVDVLAQEPLEICRLRDDRAHLAAVMAWRHWEPRRQAKEYFENL